MFGKQTFAQLRTGLTKYGFQMIFLILEDLRDFQHTVYIMEPVIVLLFYTNSIILQYVNNVSINSFGKNIPKLQ